MKDTARGKRGTSNPVVATAGGRSSANDRMDVTQSSASETDSTDAVSIDQGSVDKDTLHFSPSQEMGAEAGPSSSCSVQATASGATARIKWKTEVGSTPPQAAKKKPKRGPSPRHTFKQAQEEDLLGVVMIKDHPYTTLACAHVDWIWTQLLVKLEEATDAGRTAPTFQESSIIDSICRVQIESRTSGCVPRLDQWLYREKFMKFPCSWYPPRKSLNSLGRRCIILDPPSGVPKFLKLVQAHIKGYTPIKHWSILLRFAKNL